MTMLELGQMVSLVVLNLGIDTVLTQIDISYA